MVWEGIEPSTTALLAQRSTDWAIRPSYLLMQDIFTYRLVCFTEIRDTIAYWLHPY